jgi:uncharacterized protein (TIGR00730 family)
VSRFRVCVFTGSRSGAKGSYTETAVALGDALARRGMGLVYGGAQIGLMGAVADAALAAGGEVIGVLPESLQAREIAHANLTELHIVDSMHTRKALMVERSNAFVALPGGFGTLDELFEILTWAQLGLHQKPIALLNVEAYFDPLLRFIEQAGREGFLHQTHRDLLRVHQDIASLLDDFESGSQP